MMGRLHSGLEGRWRAIEVLYYTMFLTQYPGQAVSFLIESQSGQVICDLTATVRHRASNSSIERIDSTRRNDSGRGWKPKDS